MFGHSIKLQRLLGKLIEAMVFDKESANQPLIEAIEYYLSKPKQIDESAPRTFLSRAELEHLLTEDEFNPISKYRTFLFMAIAKGLKDKSVNTDSFLPISANTELYDQ